MRSMGLPNSGKRTLPALAVVLVITLSTASLVRAGEGGAAVSPAQARAEAANLISRVVSASEAGDVRPGTAPDWEGAVPGKPLLVCSCDGNPSQYLVPVLNSGGKVVSTIGVSATTGTWTRYSPRYQLPEFPLVDAGEAIEEVRGFLERRGTPIDLPAPEARVAPDKVVYWFFDLPGELPINDVYLPVFFEAPPLADVTFSRVKEPASEGENKRDHPRGGIGEVAAEPETPVTRAGGAPAAYDIEGVPYHVQEDGVWCGAACLEMVFDYSGPDISQSEIAGVSNTKSPNGCFNSELFRSAQFSSNSASIQDPGLHGYTARALGYGAAYEYWEDGSSLYDSRYTDLKSLVAQDYPVLILTYYDTPPSTGHFRLVKGYNDSLDEFIVHDPWYTPPWDGPDQHFNQTFLVDSLWDYSDRWGMIAAPWSVSITKPASVYAGQEFTVEASVSYRGPNPLEGQFPCTGATATLQMSSSYQIVGGEASRAIPGIDATGSSGRASWTLRPMETGSTDDIQVTAMGSVAGSTDAYGTYSDWIGGVGTGGSVPAVTSRTWGHDSVGVPNPSQLWYLAEGCTNGGFETWVLVQNPNNRPANVGLTYMTPDGATQGPTEQLPANSRKTFYVADVVPDCWDVSTMVTSDEPVIAERSMYGNNRTWGHDSIGTSVTSKQWYLAEGCTNGGFETWVLVQNPNNEPADVSLMYMTTEGAKQGPTETLPANSRKTFNVADTVPGCWDVSTLVTADRHVVAERSMYGNNRTWGHDSIGTRSPSKQWYLAEGCTNGGFETWVLVQNPNNVPATVTLNYMTPDGFVTGPTEELPANSRKTFYVGDNVPDTWEVSTTVTSDEGVIAERSMYGNHRTWGHDSIGVSVPSTKWYLAEGCTNVGFETWVLVQNPNTVPTEVTLTYMTPDGPVDGPSETLPANSRQTYNVGYTVPGAWEVSTMVTSTLPVIAERSMYGDP
ncbi:MAG: C39 family peptidase, partial [Actinobacteria bacterium]|nr:C39 family peptidase [Actinomycetota bacterium]MBU4358819.1 C39 family peptidase [Actinomycetota bacterium]